MERQVSLIVDGDFPKGIRRVSALIDDHAIDHREEDHDFEVYLRHLLEVTIMEVQLVINFFLFKDESLDVCPTAELMIGLAVRKAAGNELIDAVVLVLMEGDLTLSGEIVTEDSL